MPDLRLVKLIVVGEVKSGDRARCRVCTVPLPPAQRLLLEADERRSLGVRSLGILIGMVERPWRTGRRRRHAGGGRRE
jgi:hypothetical protein